MSIKKALSEQDKFTIGAALVFAVASAHSLSDDCKPHADVVNDMTRLLKENFCPNQVAGYAVHACLSTKFLVDPYHSDKGQTPEHQEFLRTVMELLETVEGQKSRNMTNVVQMTANEDRETHLILITDLLSRTAQKPITHGNLERVNNLARKVVELTTQT